MAKNRLANARSLAVGKRWTPAHRRLLTGKPDAGDPPVRFGREGERHALLLPSSKGRAGGRLLKASDPMKTVVTRAGKTGALWQTDKALTAFVLGIGTADATGLDAGGSFRYSCQPEAGQRHAGQADAEFAQRLPPGDGLGHAFGEFIEFAIHTLPFVLLFVVLLNRGFQQLPVTDY